VLPSEAMGNVARTRTAGWERSHCSMAWLRAKGERQRIGRGRVGLPLRAASLATISGLTEEERRSRRSLSWDAAKTVSVEEVVWHVVAHDQYHRGQVFTRLALLGRRGLPDHDLIRAT